MVQAPDFKGILVVRREFVFGNRVGLLRWIQAMLGVIRLRRLSQQNARLQLRPVLLADPGEFEFLFGGHVDIAGIRVA
jgi:hypothetical protein